MTEQRGYPEDLLRVDPEQGMSPIPPRRLPEQPVPDIDALRDVEAFATEMDQEGWDGIADALRAQKARIKELKAVARSTPQREDRIREDLFAGGYRSGDDAGEHSRMLAANERLGQGTDRLRDAHQVTLVTLRCDGLSGLQ